MTLQVSNGNPTITVDFGTADITAALQGSEGFTLQSNPNLAAIGTALFNPSVANVAIPGTLALNGSTASGINGPISLVGGTLLLDLSNLAVPTNQIGGGSSLTLGGGGLTVNFKPGSRGGFRKPSAAARRSIPAPRPSRQIPTATPTRRASWR